MVLQKDDGIIASSPELAQDSQAAGFQKCHNGSCDFWISPEAQTSVEKSGGYYSCPRCLKSYNMMYELPWSHPDAGDNYDPTRTSPSGLTVTEVGDIGEKLVEGLKQLPGYGPITWWHSGGVTGASPLDGATKDWGIEVKTILADALHHRFIAGGNRPRAGETYPEKEMKNKEAEKMGKLGVLGLLVILDMRRSVADIYAKEMPLAGWTNSTGRQINGVAHFRSNSANHLLAEVPFKNPYMDPSHPAPQSPETSPKDEIPF